ncbi:hypothetical protein YW7DRAFT_01239 [Streptomyces sp. AmelKG-E11A]|nr:hypothetical protein YW7DRAFT_01239 [Streptomyces sp. AmelKG-E11A]
MSLAGGCPAVFLRGGTNHVRTRTLSTATALAVLMGSAALGVVGAGSAVADSSRIIPVSNVGDVVVDGVGKKIFVSDPYSGRIVALDYTGRTLATVAGLPGVSGLALSADSTQLYAAVPGDNSIVSLETAGVTRTARYGTGDGTAPKHIALAGGKLWFGYGGQGEGGLGSLEPTGDEPTVTLDQDTGSGWRAAPRLEASPTEPEKLAAGATEYYGSALALYDVSGPTANRLAYAGGAVVSGDTRDLTFTADGKKLITAHPGYTHDVWDASTLADLPDYRTGSWHPNAVAGAADGSLAAGHSDSYAADVFVYRPGATAPVRSYDFPDTDPRGSASDMLADRSLVWEPGGQRLFAISYNDGGKYSLRVLDAPYRALPVLTVDVPTSATRGKELTLKGTLKATLPLRAGTEVTVTRTDAESPGGKYLGKAKTDSRGAFSFKNAPPSGGKVKYTVAYKGDADRVAVSKSDTVSVSRAKPALKLDRAGKVYAYNSKVAFTANLGKTYKNRTVKLYYDAAGDGRGKIHLRTAKVNSRGNLSATVTLKRDTTVSAVFDGDTRTSARTVTSRVGTKVKLSTWITQHYRTGSISGRTYHYVRKNKSPLFHTAMTYHKNRKYRFDVQVWFDGRWNSASPEYFALGTSGRSTLDMGKPGQAGYKLRVRSVYVDGAYGDSVNAGTVSTWKYIHTTN